MNDDITLDKETLYTVNYQIGQYDRKESTFQDLKIAEDYFEEKLKENKSPSLFVTVIQRTCRKLK